MDAEYYRNIDSEIQSAPPKNARRSPNSKYMEKEDSDDKNDS